MLEACKARLRDYRFNILLLLHYLQYCEKILFCNVASLRQFFGKFHSSCIICFFLRQSDCRKARRAEALEGFCRPLPGSPDKDCGRRRPVGREDFQAHSTYKIALDRTQFSRPGADISKKSRKERQRRFGFVGTSLVAVET